MTATYSSGLVCANNGNRSCQVILRNSDTLLAEIGRFRPLQLAAIHILLCLCGGSRERNGSRNTLIQLDFQFGSLAKRFNRIFWTDCFVLAIELQQLVDSNLI